MIHSNDLELANFVILHDNLLLLFFMFTKKAIFCKICDCEKNCDFCTKVYDKGYKGEELRPCCCILYFIFPFYILCLKVKKKKKSSPDYHTESSVIVGRYEVKSKCLHHY